MILMIEKYLGLNYFDPNSVFQDRITLNTFLNIPIFSEEFEKEDDVLFFKSGDFDFDLSLLDKTLSEDGDSINEFLFNLSSPETIFIVQLLIGDRQYDGMINLEDLEKNLTYSKQDEYKVRISVRGMLGELKDYLDQQSPPSIGGLGHPSFHDTLRHILRVELPENQRFELVDSSGIDNRVGFHVTCNVPLYDRIISRGVGGSRWKIFKEILIYLGMRVELKRLDNSPFFLLSPIFRDVISGTIENLEIIEHDSHIGTNISEPFMLVTSQHISDRTYRGILFNNIESKINDEATSNSDKFVITDEKPVIGGFFFQSFIFISSNVIAIYPPIPPSFPQPITSQHKTWGELGRIDVNWINLQGYNINIQLNGRVVLEIPMGRIFIRTYTYITFPVTRITDNGHNDILQNCTLPGLKYLLSAIETRKKLTIKMTDDLKIHPYFKIPQLTDELHTKDYLVESISNYDSENKKGKITIREFIENGV